MTDAGVRRTIPLLKNIEDSLLICEVLTVSVSSSNSGTSGSEVWSGEVTVGTVTQRPLKIRGGLVSEWDRMSGME